MQWIHVLYGSSTQHPDKTNWFRDQIMRSSLSTQGCIVSSLGQSLIQCTFAHQHPVWAALNVLVWYRHSLPCIYRIEKKKKEIHNNETMLPTEVRKLPADCSEARAELNTSASFLSSELALTFLHHNPHLPRNRWGISGWWWGICEDDEHVKGEKTVDSTPFFRWMLQQQKKKKKTVHDDEDMDRLSLELLPQERKKERSTQRDRERER